MRIFDNVGIALKAIRTSGFRALLTMLGIIIGVGAVVLMSSVGASMEKVILGQISSLGPKSMVIFPGKQEGGASQVSTGFDSLTFEDLRELEHLKTIESIAPVIFIPGNATFGREESAPQTLGVRPTFFLNQNISASHGRLLDDNDIEGAKNVAVLGPDVVDDLFGSIDPLGKRIRIGENTYTVIGISAPLGSQFFQNADERIYVPFTVARTVTGQKYLSYMTMLATDSFDAAFEDVQALLRRRHGIDNPEDDDKKDDFVVRSSAQANEILSSVSLGLTMFITTIAAISLLVGGIGIMNIMLVSVTERTREIGLRKALGARPKDILLQFLIEAVLLTVIGGIIGMIGGVFIAFLMAAIVTNFLSTYVFVISVQAMIVSFFMAFFTGIVFGLRPARHAANLHPIDALRYE